MLRGAPLFLAFLLACASKDAGDESGSDVGNPTSTETDSTETGPECTDISCSSSFVVRIGHSLDLPSGPHQILVNTTDFELICSLSTEASGTDNCFGNAYVNIAWDASNATITLMDPPFFDAVDNPEGLPVESAEIVVNLDGNTLYQQTHPVDAGQPQQPDPCGPVCWDASVSVSID